MANCCFVKLCVRGEDESLKKFRSIAKGTDYKHHLCRAEFLNQGGIVDGTYSVFLNVDWGCGMILDTEMEKEFKDEGLVSVQSLCRDLNLKAEIWGREAEQNFFEEHYLVDNDGSVVLKERKDIEIKLDDEGFYVLDEDEKVIIEGGFKEWGKTGTLRNDSVWKKKVGKAFSPKKSHAKAE